MKRLLFSTLADENVNADNSEFESNVNSYLIYF